MQRANACFWKEILVILAKEYRIRINKKIDSNA